MSGYSSAKSLRPGITCQIRQTRISVFGSKLRADKHEWGAAADFCSLFTWGHTEYTHADAKGKKFNRLQRPLFATNITDVI